MTDKTIEVYTSCGITFWMKKGDSCSSRDIMELALLVNDGWTLVIRK